MRVKPSSADGSVGIRVAVADDEDTVVEVLRALVGSDPTLRFVGAAQDAEEAIQMVLRERPDVLLLDVRMPGGGGLRAVREITRRCDSTKVVALSAHEDPDTVIRMIGAGASAYVPKADSTEKILREIHRSVDASWSPHETGARLRLVPPDVSRHDERGSRVARAILDGAVTAEFEPIVDLATGNTVGLDARPRVATLPHRSYDAWTADARSVGLLEDLELAALRASLAVLRLVPEELFVEFEVSPSTACAGRFRHALKRPAASRVVLGFTPMIVADEAGSGDADLIAALGALRERGVRLSAREVGPGLEGLRHLSFLLPEFARLDPTITRPVAGSFASHSVIAAAAAFAAEVGATVVATDVSSGEQVRELSTLGVRLVQGPLVGRAMHLSEVRAHPDSLLRPIKSADGEADDGKEGVAPSDTSASGGRGP